MERYEDNYNKQKKDYEKKIEKWREGLSHAKPSHHNLRSTSSRHTEKVETKKMKKAPGHKKSMK